MRKGMLSGLWSLKWVLLCLLLTGCPKSDPPPPPPPPSPEITVTGQVMLGPVVGGHSLQIVIYDTEMNELIRPKIGLDGGYGFTLKDYEGAVIAQVTSTKPQQECSVGDYIDEATAKPKCLGNNSILSSTVLKLDNTSSDNQAKLHTTSVTTIAALNAGINIKEDGTIGVNNNLSPEIIDRSNKIISQALGLGDQSVAEYTPKSIITTDQKFQSGDAYSQALAEISGIEAEGKSLNSIVKVISAGIGKNGKLSPAVQDMMVKGNQKVFKKAKEQGADTTILNQINKRQDTYPDSIAKVDLVNAPEPPVFKNKAKTSNQKPTWEWISGGTGNERYQYRFGAEDDIQNVRVWTETSSSSFTSKDNLISGKYTLEIQEGHLSDPTIWSMVSSSTIEIIANQKGSVIIEGEAIQGRKLLAVTTDKDGIQGDVSYQWYRDNKTIKNANYSDYVLTENDVNTAIMVKVSYIDNIDYAERDIQSAPVKIDNTNDQPLITSSAKNEAEEGKKYSYQVKIEDSDKNSTAKYRLIAKPNGMAINKVGLITWIPENKASDYTANVSVEVDDSSGASNATSQQVFIITVKANDDKPVLNKPDNVVLKEDAARHVIALVAKDIDNEDKAITYDVDSNNSEIAKVTLTANNDLQITPIPNKHGTATITVIAKSNNQTATTAFNLNIENTDDAPTLIAGKSIISGSPKQGGTLTADPTVISDADGIIENSYTFEWNANDELLKGETGHTIALTQDHVGKQISVKVSYRDTYGTDYKKSAKTKAIANKKDNPTLIAGKSIISGSPKQGGTLTADPTVISDADGIIENSYTFEWNANDELLKGETGHTIALTQDHVGKQISVKVSYRDTYGTDYKKSAKTKAIANKKDNPTLIAGKSIISGSPKQGGTLTADPTVISDADGIIENSYTFEWNANDELLKGETGHTIALTQDHVGKQISVKVSYRDTYGTDYKKSAKTKAIANKKDNPTLIAGKSIISGSPKQGGTLTADPTVISDADGIIENSYTYEWNANDELLKDETGHTIALTQDHVGKQISVKVSYTDSYGGDYKESAKTKAIENKKDHPKLIAGKSIISGSPQQGDTLTADSSVISDADGIIENSYTYEWNANDELLKDETGHTIALTQDHVGKQISVKVSYRDSYGKDYIESEKTLDVVNTNDQPKINSDPKLEAEEDKQYTYQLEVTDADKDSQAKYKLVRQQNASTMKISNEGLITWTPENKDRDYTADVTVEVDDETGTSNATNQQEFTINVKAHDDAPKIETKLDDIEVEENSEVFEIPLYTTDIDNENAAITYQAASSDNNIATVEIKNENTLNIRPVKYQYGEVKIIVTAVSNGKSVEKDFQLIIKNKNDAPNGKVTIKFSNQPYSKLSADVSSIYDPDGIKSYNYQWKADNSEIMGALYSEFVPTDEEIGKQISVVVTIEDSLGNKSQFISDKTPSLKVSGIPPTVKDVTETLAQSKDSYSNIKTILETFNYAKYIKYKSTQTPLTFVITSLPSRGVIINNDGIEITKMENGKYLEVSEGFKYKRTMAGKDSFEYKGKRDNILSLKPATVNISYNNKAPNASAFTISAAVETETRPIPFADKITDDQDLTKGIIITNNPQAGNLYIDGESFDASKLETLIDINSNVTYKSTNTSNSSDSFKYLAIDTDDERSYERKVNIEFKHDNKAPKINKEPTQTNLMIDEAGKQISFKFKITDDSSSYDAYDPMFLSTKGNTSQPLWISINTDKQSDSPFNYTVNATLNDESYANDSIRVLIPVVDDLGLKSKYAFVINPELSVDTQNKFIQKNNTTWVDVCWQFSEKTANLDSTKITEIKQEIMNTISDSWQKNSALKFDWREDDWDAIQDGKRQLFKWDSPSNCAENYTAEYAQVKVYIKQEEEVGSKQAENRFTINLNVKADGSFEDAYPKHKIIHEFGHALGFPEEDKRFDTFRNPLSPVSQFSCNDIMVVYIPKDENQNIAENSVKKITHTKWQKQLFNSFSIMNECIFSNSEIMKRYDFTTVISGSKLGFNDINRLQYFYGAPATAETSHLMKADQFFTGLYLDGDVYKYYENGIANSSYSPIEKSNLQSILSSDYHFSITNNEISVKTKTVLFKHEATTVDYPEFIPRETSPVAACEVTGTNSQDENNQQKIQFDLNCDTIESVATHKLINEERSIYYKADSLVAIQMYYCKTKKEDTTAFKEQFNDKDVCLDLTDNFSATLSSNNTHNLFSNGKKEFVFWLIETNQ